MSWRGESAPSIGGAGERGLWTSNGWKSWTRKTWKSKWHNIMTFNCIAYPLLFVLLGGETKGGGETTSTSGRRARTRTASGTREGWAACQGDERRGATSWSREKRRGEATATRGRKWVEEGGKVGSKESQKHVLRQTNTVVKYDLRRSIK